MAKNSKKIQINAALIKIIISTLRGIIWFLETRIDTKEDTDEIQLQANHEFKVLLALERECEHDTLEDVVSDEINNLQA